MNEYLGSKLLDKAISMAVIAHHGQTDKSGTAYILHVIHVMNQFNTEFSKICAVLHDIVEDSDITIEEIEKEFDTEIANIVSLLTHRKEDTYEEYIRKIKEGKGFSIFVTLTATFIKKKDLEHNMDLNRLATKTTKKDLERNLKYFKAHMYLETGIWV